MHRSRVAAGGLTKQGCGRKPEHPKETHVNTGRTNSTPTGSKPRTNSCCEATGLTNSATVPAMAIIKEVLRLLLPAGADSNW